MSATVIAYWPGITEEQIESQPGFYNDCNAWGNWMAEREGEPEVLNSIKKLDADKGMTDEEVLWVTPKELREAVARIREAIQAEKPGSKIILETYGRSANGVDLIGEEFVRDLDDIEAITNWAEEEGTDRMTLEVNW